MRNRLRDKILCASPAGRNVRTPTAGSPTKAKWHSVRQTELTSLIGLQDDDGDRLHLVRLDRPNGTSGYVLRVGTGKVLLSAGDLARLNGVIRLELLSANRIRLLNWAIQLLILCALAWLLAYGVTGPLFAYPWSN